MRASETAPNRAEALHGACRLCRLSGRYDQAYDIGKRGLGLPPPVDGLFVEPWIYEYGLRDEFAVSAYWSGHYQECLNVCLEILACLTFPEGDRKRIIDNAQFALQNLTKHPDLATLEIPVRTIFSPIGGYVPGSASKPATPAEAKLVSIITPTGDRAQYLHQLTRCVLAQDYQRLEWFILDDSPTPAKEFEDLARTSTTNISIENSRSARSETFLSSRRKVRSSSTSTTMISTRPITLARWCARSEENGLDLLNLRGWFLNDLRSGRLFAYWDLMQKEGPHYRCDSDGVNLLILGPENDRIFHDTHFGFGFSFVYRRSIWEVSKFPDVSFDEDGAFSRSARGRFKVGGVHDTTGLVLHRLYEGSTSRCYPQQIVPQFLLGRIFRNLPPLAEHANPHFSDVQSTWFPARPLGGTELMYEALNGQQLGAEAGYDKSPPERL